MTKDQILQGYLNLVYYGDQAYGVEAAAQHYFSVSAGEAQPAPGRPAGRPRPAPRARPTRSTTPRRAQARRDVVLDRMHELGMITDKDLKAAKAVPVKKMLKPRAGAEQLRGARPQPYFCDYVIAYLKDTAIAGARQDHAGAHQEHQPAAA